MSRKKKGTSARTRYMIADFTPEDRNRITDYCRRKHTTISSFLANIALQEVYRADREGPIEVEVEITLKIPAEQSAKLHVFAHRQGKTIDQYVLELVTPTLEKGKTSFHAQTESLRYYLSADEHRMLKRYLKSKNLSARTYIAYLALKAIHRNKKATGVSKPRRLHPA